MSHCFYCDSDFVSGQPCRTPAQSKKCPENGVNRSFFAGLTDEQKKLALEYDGPEDHGDQAYKRS